MGAKHMNRSNTELTEYVIRPVGIIHSPFQQQSGTPLQSAFGERVEATATVFPEFAPALRDLDGFKRAWLLCWLDRAAPAKMLVTPYLDTQPRGVFATRAPSRPNPIGLSCVRLLEVRDQEIRFAGVDLLDGTPLVDIKPYLPEFDAHEAGRCGWYEQVQVRQAVADDRFAIGPSRGSPQATTEPGRLRASKS